MIIKFISGILILFTAYMGIKHGWQLLSIKVGQNGPDMELIRKLNLSEIALKAIGIFTLLSAVMIVFPQTFVAGNMINAFIILTIMARLLSVGEIKPALIEIPFLIIPLLLIYLKHPFFSGTFSK